MIELLKQLCRHALAHVLAVEAPGDHLEMMVRREVGKGVIAHNQLRPLQGVEKLQLRHQPLVFRLIGTQDGEAAIGNGRQRIQAPKQGRSPQHQHPVSALPGQPLPEAFAQALEPFAVLAQLAL